MAESIQAVVAEIMKNNIELQTSEVVRRAKLRGLKAADVSIQNAVYNLRPQLRKQQAAALTAPTQVAPAAARGTAPAKAAAATPVAPVEPAKTADLEGVLSNVELVNKIVGLCGGIENARQAAEAVQACGGLEAFLQHLAVVATVRGSNSAS